MALSVAPTRGTGKVLVARPTAAGSAADPAVVEMKRRIVEEVVAALDAAEGTEWVQKLAEARTLAEKEEQLVGLCRWVQAAMTRAACQGERGYQGSRTTCAACGRRARYVKDEAKSYTLLTGEVRLSRSVYECFSCRHRWHPLDAAWNLPSGRFGEGVQRLVSLVGGMVPFASAAQMLQEAPLRLNISASEIRAITEGIGQEMEEQTAREVAAAATGSLDGEASPPLLVMAADGAMLLTREEGWKETKVGRVTAYRRKGGSWVAMRSQYVAHLGSVEDFRPKLDAAIQRQGREGVEATLFLGDGAAWIWEMADEIAPHAIQVLDFYHLCEHVHSAAKVFFGEESPEGRPWAEHVCHRLLRQGRVAEALAVVGATGSEEEKDRQAREGLIRYIETHRERMNYPALEAKGYPIGSGCVESACKQIVHKRHRQAGMRWSLAGAQRMLQLAVYTHSSRWEEFWRERRARGASWAA